MKQWLSQYRTGLSIILMLVHALNPLWLYASSDESKHATPKIILLPVTDGNLDQEAQEIVQSIQRALSENNSLDLVSQDQFKDVFQYYQESNPLKQVSENERRLTEAKQYYLKADFKKSETAVDEVIGNLALAQDAGFYGPILFEAYLTKALCNWAFQKNNVVRNSLDHLIWIAPLYQPETNAFPPGFVKLFQEVRKKIWQGPLGKVGLDVSPAGADVYLNGIKLCVSPCNDVELPANRYAVAVQANHYTPVTDTITVTDSHSVRYNYRLNWEKIDKSKTEQSKSVEDNALFERIKSAATLGEKLKVDKVVLVDCKSITANKALTTLRVVDVRSQSGQEPLFFNFIKGKTISQKRVDSLVSALSDQLLSDPSSQQTDPRGFGNSTVLEKKHKKFTKQPAFWIGIGAIALTGIILGILSATGGGGGESPQDSKIKLRIQ